MKTEIKKLPKSELEISFELTAEEFNQYIDRSLDHLKKHTKMDGFRPGTVPKDIVEKQVGQENLLMEAGDLAVKESYTRYVNENNVEPIGHPEVQIKKIAKGSELLFAVKVSVLPEVELADYKKIASEIKRQDVSVSEKEIEDALNYLQKSRAKFIDKEVAEEKDYVKIEYQNENINDGKPTKDMFILGEGGFVKDFEDTLIGMKVGEEKEFLSKLPDNHPNKDIAGKEGTFKVKMLVVQKMELPEINDEFAKGLGVFDNLVALKDNIKQGITMEKQEGEKQRKRGEVLNNIAEKSKFELPEKMIEMEKERLFEDLKNQIVQQFKMSFEEYLKAANKTEEEIKDNLKKEAEKRVKNYLILRQIGKVEKVEVSKEEIENEMNKFIRNYTKEEADKIDINQLKEYTKESIVNEKIFQILENLSSK